MKENKRQPPKILEWFIMTFLAEKYHDEVIGDLNELFEQNLDKHSLWTSKGLYALDLIFMLRPYLFKNKLLQNTNAMMFTHYFKMFYRNFLREKTYTAFNLIGLTTGIAIFFLSILYVRYEVSFDQFHSKIDNLYRVHQKFNDGGQTASASYPIGSALLADYPQIKKMARFNRIWNTRVIAGDEKYIEQDILLVEPGLFDLLDFEFVKGSPASLEGPYDIILNDQVAEKYFGESDPVGQSLKFPFLPDDNTFVVRGVVKAFPANSHLTFSMLGNIELATWLESRKTIWADPVVYTYVEIEDREFAEEIMASRLTDFVDRHFTKDIGEGAYLPVMPIKDVHLKSDVYFEFGTNSSEKYVYMMASISILILLLAAINFINLSTARSISRAKEVGVRKVLGAHKTWLVKQFLFESLMTTFIAVLLALGVCSLVLPYFNELMNVTIGINFLESPELLFLLAGIWLLVGFLAGLYPSFALSAFKPVLALKGKVENTSTRFPLRKVLITAQLSIVIILVLSIVTIDSQLNYMLKKDMGFDKDNMVYLRMPDSLTNNQSKQLTLKNDLLKNPNIKSVSSSWGMPGGNDVGFAYRNYKYEGMEEGARMGGGVMYANHDYVETVGLKLISGRTFSREYSSDTLACLINETAMKEFGWETALGKELEVVGFNKYKVIGVLKDFNFENLRKKIHPMVVALDPSSQYFNIGIRVSGDLASTIPFIQSTWDNYSDGWPVQIQYLDDSIEMLYQEENTLSLMVRALTCLAIVIAVLGILGLSSYSVSKRIKEVGIRKVLGASVTKILVLLGKDYIILAGIAAVIGIPIALLVVDKWLEEFAYRISVDLLLAGSSVLVVLVITLVTVSFHTIRAAKANPIKSLRYE